MRPTLREVAKSPAYVDVMAILKNVEDEEPCIVVNRYECNLEQFCNEPSHIPDADCSFSPWR